MKNDDKLVERAVVNARHAQIGKHPRWVAVKDVFACGKTSAQELCSRFDLSPDEPVQGRYHVCPDCGDEIMDESGFCPECS